MKTMNLIPSMLKMFDKPKNDGKKSFFRLKKIQQVPAGKINLVSEFCLILQLWNPLKNETRCGRLL